VSPTGNKPTILYRFQNNGITAVASDVAARVDDEINVDDGTSDDDDDDDDFFDDDLLDDVIGEFGEEEEPDDVKDLGEGFPDTAIPRRKKLEEKSFRVRGLAIL